MVLPQTEACGSVRVEKDHHGVGGVKVGAYTDCRNVAAFSAVKPFSSSSATAWY